MVLVMVSLGLSLVAGAVLLLIAVEAESEAVAGEKDDEAGIEAVLDADVDDNDTLLLIASLGIGSIEVVEAFFGFSLLFSTKGSSSSTWMPVSFFLPSSFVRTISSSLSFCWTI